MSNLVNGDLVTVISYKRYSQNNCPYLSTRKDLINLREEEVYKSGKKTCMIGNDRWSHEDINKKVHKEGITFDSYKTVVRFDECERELGIENAIEEVKTRITKSKQFVLKEMECTIKELKVDKGFEVKDKR